jgi:hypothetical protein
MESENAAEIERLMAELGIHADKNDLDALRLEIKARLAESHPDAKVHHGDDRVQELATLLKMVGNNSTELASVSTTKELAVKSETLPAPLSSSTSLTIREAVEARIQSVREVQHKTATKSFLFPKISLGAFTVAIGWIFAFPKSFYDHPFIGPLLKGPHAMQMWLGVLCAFVFAWISVWFLEQQKNQQSDRLLSLPFQKSTLDAMDRTERGAFSASEFQDALYPRQNRYPRMIRKLTRLKLYFYANPLYDDVLADQATALALDRFVARGWITRAPKPEGEKGIDDWYRLND